MCLRYSKIPEYFDPVESLNYLKQLITYSYELKQGNKENLINEIDDQFQS